MGRAAAVVALAVLATVAGCSSAGAPEPSGTSAVGTSTGGGSTRPAPTTSTGSAAVLPASDEFDGTALTGWDVFQGDDVGDGVDHLVTVADGSLDLRPRTSWWVNDTRALLVSRSVTGDFVATTKVDVTGVSTPVPQSNWTLSGILVRDPSSGPGDENWLSLRTGFVDGAWVYERKTTVGSTSTLVLSPSAPGWTELRLARVGSRFLLLRLDPGRSWSLVWTYDRPDLPETLQVGLDGFTGYESDAGDLRARADWFRFAAAPVGAGQAGTDDLVAAIAAVP